MSKPYVEQKFDDVNSQLSLKAKEEEVVAIQAQISTIVAVSGNTDNNAELLLNRTDSIGNTFASVPDRINNIEKIIKDGKTQISYNDWVQGALSISGEVATEITSTTRLRSTYKSFIPGEKIDIIIATGYYVRVYQFDSAQRLKTNSEYNGTVSIDIFYPLNRFIIRKSGDSTITTPENVNCVIIKKISSADIEYFNKLIVTGKNKFNPEDKISGYLSSAIAITASASYWTTGFIKYKNGDIVIVKHCRKLARYEISGNTFVDNTSNSTYTFTATADGYVRASFQVAYLEDMQVQVGSSVTEESYEPYHYEFSISNSSLTMSYIKEHLSEISPLYQKSICSFGDSIMHGAGNGGVGIRDLIADKYNMTGADYSVSGATFEYKADKSHIVAQIQGAISASIAPDIILIDGGVNDMNYEDIGTISSDYDYASHGYADFASGMEYAFGLLKNNFPKVPIIYIRVHRVVSRDAAKQISFGELAVSICEKWGVYYVDLYKQGMNTNIPIICLNYTYDTYGTGLGDGTHPNFDGYKEIYLPPIINEAEKRIKIN